MEYEIVEPLNGPFDWEESFRQNPGSIDETFCQDPGCEHPGCNGAEPSEESMRALAAAIVVQTEGWLTIAHLDGENE
jgi:hypothetical protein